MSLLDLITGNVGNQVATEAENKFGISKSQMIALAAVAAPLIISYLRNKSQDAKEAEALNNALDRDHDGSILNNPSSALEREQEGGSILDHIFGGQKATVENQLSQNTGISMDKIGPILAMLAPIIMGYIGKEKQAVVERYVEFGRNAQEKEHLVAFDPEIRKLLGINEQKLKDELNQMKRLHDGAIKTNETLVKYKNDLLKENEDLVEKLNAYSFITFWQRLLFLFTGKLGDTK
jgi:hypothetical protein